MSRVCAIFENEIENIYVHFYTFKRYDAHSSPSVELKSNIAMELFQKIRESWQIMGINRPIGAAQTHSFNLKNLFFLISLIVLCISTTAFLLFRANTLFEYGSCMYAMLSSLCTFCDILIGIWQIPITFKMIKTCKRFIQISMHRHLRECLLSKFCTYSNSMARIEKRAGLESNVRGSHWKDRKNVQMGLHWHIQSNIYMLPSDPVGHRIHQLFDTRYARRIVSGCAIHVTPLQCCCSIETFPFASNLLYFSKAAIQLQNTIRIPTVDAFSNSMVVLFDVCGSANDNIFHWILLAVEIFYQRHPKWFETVE